ncbi:hypothetical protein ACLVWU_12315 [Bdellovibrio sp. HCB290]|uniref:hypothetical protein n=1 Tax=Bdellovibrio sp. HCB290 TaxID=3394356 RepID=UPI0039B61799
MRKPHLFLGKLSLLSLLVLSACATPAKKDDNFISPDATAVPTNSISINYALRQNVYLFELNSQGGREFDAKSAVNEKVIEKRKISKEHYISFANRIYDFAEKYKDSKSADSDCRSPFKIRMEKNGQVSEVEGCRTNDTGELGKIIREGEILFYAQ